MMLLFQAHSSLLIDTSRLLTIRISLTTILTVMNIHGHCIIPWMYLNCKTCNKLLWCKMAHAFLCRSWPQEVSYDKVWHRWSISVDWDSSWPTEESSGCWMRYVRSCRQNYMNVTCIITGVRLAFTCTLRVQYIMLCTTLKGLTT